jgi:hypothetical protein
LAKKVATQNGHQRLEEALALLVQNQAAFVNRFSETDRAHAEAEQRRLELERQHLELKQQSDERFARIEAQMAEIIRVLNEHGRILERLPDAIREKIGFKGQS